VNVVFIHRDDYLFYPHATLCTKMNVSRLVPADVGRVRDLGFNRTIELFSDTPHFRSLAKPWKGRAP
jgi:hypothetical protein